MLLVRSRQPALQRHTGRHSQVLRCTTSLPGDLTLQWNLQDLLSTHDGKIRNCANGSHQFPISSLKSIKAVRGVLSCKEDPGYNSLVVCSKQFLFSLCLLWWCCHFRRAKWTFKFCKLGCKLLSASVKSDIFICNFPGQPCAPTCSPQISLLMCVRGSQIKYPVWVGIMGISSS